MADAAKLQEEDAERANHRPRKVFGADVEVMERSFRLRAPVAIGGDRDFAHAVRFFPRIRHK